MKLDAEAAAATAILEEQENKRKAGGFLSILKESDMKEPKLMTVKEMEDYIVQVQKKELLKMYLE